MGEDERHRLRERLHSLEPTRLGDVVLDRPQNRRPVWARSSGSGHVALLDALQHGGAYHDDSQIVSLCITKREVVPAGRTLVTIEKSAC